MTDWWIDESPPVGPAVRPTLWSAPDSDPMGDINRILDQVSSYAVAAMTQELERLATAFKGMVPLMQAIEDEIDPPPLKGSDGGRQNNTGPRPNRAFGHNGRKRY